MFSFDCNGHRCDLHSFPTRRSSDLHLRSSATLGRAAFPRSVTARHVDRRVNGFGWRSSRSEEHTSELQSLARLLCRLLLEQKNALDAFRDTVRILVGDFLRFLAADD